MKNLLISLSLITTLAVSHLALSQEEAVANVEANKMETVMVVATPEVGNFEIYSLELAEQTLDSVLEIMADSLADSGKILIDSAVKIGTSI